MKILGHILLISTLALGISSCNDIKQDDRFIDLPAVEVNRCVLMEEFTGQICVNCPAAHEVINALHEQFPEGLVTVGIHSGGDAFSFSEDKMPGIGLRTAEGQAICESYKVASLPAAVINGTSGVLNVDAWHDYIRKELEKPSKLKMDIVANLSEDGKKVEVASTIEAFENLAGELHLWVVENGIVSMQLTPSGYVKDYVHNHVFRGSVNGENGDKVNLSPYTEFKSNSSVDVKDTWNTDNLEVVGFVRNANEGVLQAVQVKVVKAAA